MELLDKKWNEKEIKLFKKLYPTDIAMEDLLEKFPNRSVSALAHKASRLGIKKGKYIPKTRTSRKWTVDEIKFVQRHYGQAEDKWILDFMPHRSIASIKKIVGKYKPKKRRKSKFSRNPSWSEWENEQLLEHYKSKTTDELTDIIPNRTYDAIRAHMYVLGLSRELEDLKRARPTWLWSEEELLILKENRNKPVSELAELLENRSQNAIRCERRRILKNAEAAQI